MFKKQISKTNLFWSTKIEKKALHSAVINFYHPIKRGEDFSRADEMLTLMRLRLTEQFFSNGSTTLNKMTPVIIAFKAQKDRSARFRFMTTEFSYMYELRKCISSHFIAFLRSSLKIIQVPL